jgi:hypothetical protein
MQYDRVGVTIAQPMLGFERRDEFYKLGAERIFNTTPPHTNAVQIRKRALLLFSHVSQCGSKGGLQNTALIDPAGCLKFASLEGDPLAGLDSQCV